MVQVTHNLFSFSLHEQSIFRHSNEVLTEQWYLHGQIEGLGKRHVLGTSLFTAAFTEPNIVFSKEKLTFRYDAGLGVTETMQTGL